MSLLSFWILFFSSETFSHKICAKAHYDVRPEKSGNNALLNVMPLLKGKHALSYRPVGLSWFSSPQRDATTTVFNVKHTTKLNGSPHQWKKETYESNFVSISTTLPLKHNKVRRLKLNECNHKLSLMTFLNHLFILVSERMDTRNQKRNIESVEGDLSIMQEEKSAKQSNSFMYVTAETIDQDLNTLTNSLKLSDDDSTDGEDCDMSMSCYQEDGLLNLSESESAGNYTIPVQSSTPTKITTADPSTFTVPNNGAIEEAEVLSNYSSLRSMTCFLFTRKILKILFSNFILDYRKRNLEMATNQIALMLSMFPLEYPEKVIGPKELKIISEVVSANSNNLHEKERNIKDPELIVRLTSCDIKHGQLQYTVANQRSLKWLELTFNSITWADKDIPNMLCAPTSKANPSPTFSLFFPLDIDFEDVKKVMQSHFINTDKWVHLHTGKVTSGGFRTLFLGDEDLKEIVGETKNNLLRLFHMFESQYMSIKNTPAVGEELSKHHLLTSAKHDYSYASLSHFKTQTRTRRTVTLNRKSLPSAAKKRKLMPHKTPYRNL